MTSRIPQYPALYQLRVEWQQRTIHFVLVLDFGMSSLNSILNTFLELLALLVSLNPLFFHDFVVSCLAELFNFTTFYSFIVLQSTFLSYFRFPFEVFLFLYYIFIIFSLSMHQGAFFSLIETLTFFHTFLLTFHTHLIL